MFSNIGVMLDKPVAERLFGVRGFRPELWHAINDISREVKPVQIVTHRHVKWRRRGAFFLVSAHVEIGVIGSAVGQAVDQPGIAMIGKNNWLISREEDVELCIR